MRYLQLIALAAVLSFGGVAAVAQETPATPPAAVEEGTDWGGLGFWGCLGLLGWLAGGGIVPLSIDRYGRCCQKITRRNSTPPGSLLIL